MIDARELTLHDFLAAMSKDAALIQYAFRAQVERRRRYVRAFFIPLGALVTCTVVAITPGFGRMGLRAVFELLAFTLVSGLALIAIYLATPRLKCVACGRKIDAIDTFCPECGKPNLPKVRWNQYRRCNSCGKQFVQVYRASRNWTIRFCTYCGVRLHETGV